MTIEQLPGTPGGDDDARQFNADELTEQERAALEAKDEDTTAGGDPAADAEAQRAEQERQEQERQAEEARAAEAAAAAPAVEEPGEPPAAPEDFASARAKADEDMRNGLLDAVDYQHELDRIRSGQAEHARALAEHQAAVSAFEQAQAARAEAAKSAEEAWVSDYNAFAKDNAEFMGNPLYVRDMQTVINDLLRTDPSITNADLLSKAYEQVAKYHRYEKPAPANDAIVGALKNRVQERPGQTLGDVPAARSETITGNETFDALDNLPIGELEDTLANMSEAQRERYLRAAPGANSTGRD